MDGIMVHVTNKLLSGEAGLQSGIERESPDYLEGAIESCW